jgi:hypothetical protein
VVGDALGREAGLEQRLQAVVLGRVHPDEHRSRELDREAGRRHHHAAGFGGVGLPVAAHRVDVLGRGHRPEACLLGKLFEALGPVDGAALAHLLEHAQRRTVLPVLALGEFDACDVTPDRCHLKTLLVAAVDARSMVLAGWPICAPRSERRRVRRM